LVYGTHHSALAWQHDLQNAKESTAKRSPTPLEKHRSTIMSKIMKAVAVFVVMPIAFFMDGQFSLVIGVVVALILGVIGAYIDDGAETRD
jgi:hypothetical protein